MGKKAVCVGIDDYPGEENDLGGCVNDAGAWAGLLVDRFGFHKDDVKMILDGEATELNVLSALDELVGGGRSGDVLAFIYSGHGTWVPDRGPKDEADGRDEALVPCEADFGRLILDDDIRAGLDRLAAGVSLTFIADSCYSGTATRFLPGPGRMDRVRFYPPPPNLVGEVSSCSPLKRRLFGSDEEQMPEIFMSAAGCDEPAGEGVFNGVTRGVFSYFAIETLKESGPDMTYGDWITRIRDAISAAGFSQSPQLEGPARLKRRRVFSAL